MIALRLIPTLVEPFPGRVLDDSAIELGRLSRHRQITDAYMVALAVSNDGRVATVDRGLPLGAVHGAEKGHVIVL